MVIWILARIVKLIKLLHCIFFFCPLQLIRFYNSFNVSVRNIRISNSPQCHLKFDSSGGIRVKNVTISSPGDSPNTDGIHLQNTKDVEIRSSTIGCGN